MMAMKVALDTNRYVDFCRGDATVVARVQEATEVFLPFVTLAELRAGFLCGTKGTENEKTLVDFLKSRRVSVLYADEETTRQYARLFLQLRTQGTPIPTNDLWIAALVIQHRLVLFARDQHFARLPQLDRI